MAKKLLKYIVSLLVLILLPCCSVKISNNIAQDCGKIRIKRYLNLMYECVEIAKEFASDVDSLIDPFNNSDFFMLNTSIHFIGEYGELIFYYDSLEYNNNQIQNLKPKPVTFCDFTVSLPNNYISYSVQSDIYRYSRENIIRISADFERIIEPDSSFKQFVLLEYSLDSLISIHQL